ncbi:glutathione S-transferase family protein [Lacibacterium aquatile]|uniref:Glutathione S-transferase family protein n=1 Tax=Lacibacterium aquatile TaxID=1168082 RepID=A0ABW5DLQ8_9PROT
MDPILFYGVPEGCSFGTIVALEWSGIPYRLSRIGMPEEVSGEVYRAINPVGETPTLLTARGDLLNESMAILNHINGLSVADGRGFAQGTAEFDRQNAMLAYLNTSFFNAFAPLWYAFEHTTEGSVEKKILTAYGKGKVAKTHAMLEKMLGDNEWLLGKQRSQADAYFIGIARWADFHQAIDRRDYPGLDRLRTKLEADPAVRFAQAIEHEEAATSVGQFKGHVSLAEILASRQAA